MYIYIYIHIYIYRCIHIYRKRSPVASEAGLSVPERVSQSRGGPRRCLPSRTLTRKPNAGTSETGFGTTTLASRRAFRLWLSALRPWTDWPFSGYSGPPRDRQARLGIFRPASKH